MTYLVALSTSAAMHPGPWRRWLPLLAHSGLAPGSVRFLGLHPRYQGHQTTDHYAGIPVAHVAQMHVDGNGHPYTGRRLIGVALQAVLRLAQAGIAARPQYVLVCKAQPMNGLAALLIQAATGAQIILDVDDDEAASHQVSRPWQRHLLHWWQRWVPRRAASISAVSRPLATLMHEIGGQRICVIPNGLDDAQYVLPTPAESGAFRRTHHLPPRYLVYFGNVAHRSHAIDLLLAAQRRRQGGLPLVIAGAGHDQHLLATHDASPLLHWIGAVAPAAIPALLAGAVATVDPVRDTPAMRARSPLKIIESLAQGVPVLSSAVGDRASTIGQAGLLIPADDAQALATAMDACPLPTWDPAQCRAQVQGRHWRQLAPAWAAHHRLHADESRTSCTPQR